MADDDIRIVLMGPPGVGKGTQAKLLTETLAVPHISSGDLFRTNYQEATPLGMQIKKYMTEGLLVPENITISIVMEAVLSSQAKKGFILDGFPRTITQAEALDQALTKQNKFVDFTLNIDVPTEQLVKRLASRLLCSSCQTTYNTETQPPKSEGLCDLCNTPLYQRDDDGQAAVKKRFQVYNNDSRPLLKYYGSQGKLINIDGTGTLMKVHQHLLQAISNISSNNIPG